MTSTPQTPTAAAPSADDEPVNGKGVDQGTPQRDLDRILLRGLAWTGIGRWGTQVLTWAATLIIASALDPSDYGVYGMAMVFVGFTAILNEAGLGLTVVTLRELSRRQVAELNTVALALGGLCCAVACAISPLIAAFYQTDAVQLVVVVMSTSLVFGALRTVPVALLQKELRFRATVAMDVVRGLVQIVAMLIMALSDFGYWTLALGHVIGEVTWTVLALSLRAFPFARPHRDSTGAAIGFSGQLLLARLSWYVRTNVDFLVAGRVLGKVALGAYTFAWTFASLPVQKVSAIVQGVSSTFFSAVQHDHAQLRHYLLRITEGISVITFPAAVGLLIVSDPFFPMVLGEKWRGMLAPFQVLALYGSVQSVAPLVTQVLVVTKQTRYQMWHSLFATVVLTVSFVIASRWGTVGIAGVWLLVYPFTLLPLYWRAFRTIDLPVGDYARALWPAASSAGLMAAAVYVTRPLTVDTVNPGVHLFVQIAVGVVTYAAAFGLLHRRRIDALRETMRTLREKPAAA